jgi:pimeloyl-ACP methyl ester carboxylesterase
MPEHRFEEYLFAALDGFPCSLWRLKQDGPSPEGPVLLVHGAGVSGNIFNPPTRLNLIDVLAEAGYDVWLENWRGSIACPPNQWDLDQAAVNDHPVAVKEVCRRTGSPDLKAVIHCQGSTSFMISAVKGLVPEVRTVVSNAVSLHPVVPWFSKIKLQGALPVIEAFTPFLNPHWGDDPDNTVARWLRFMVDATHWERDTRVGKFVSFTYGTGHPALWELSNLSSPVMEWIRGEFGQVPVSFFEHIHKCVSAGQLVSSDGSVRYADQAPKTEARFVFLTGKKNKCFLHESQEKSFEYFNLRRPGYHRLYEYAGYSHLDIFLGDRADQDVFPDIVRELQQ